MVSSARSSGAATSVHGTLTKGESGGAAAAGLAAGGGDGAVGAGSAAGGELIGARRVDAGTGRATGAAPSDGWAPARRRRHASTAAATRTIGAMTLRRRMRRSLRTAPSALRLVRSHH